MNRGRIWLRVLALCALLVVSSAAFAQHLVISQVYGGGGNTNAPLTNDFIELYNPTANPVSLAGYSVQYGSASGTSTWSGVTPLSGTIAPGGYYLVKEAGGTVGSAMPAADATGSINMSASSGKVALVSSTTALSGACPTTNVVDLIGFGSANCFEGALATGGSNTLAMVRKDSATDTNNNSADFMTAAPNPRNSTYGQAVTLSGVGTAVTWFAGEPALLKVTVTPATDSTGISVSADLSQIGGSASQSFYDDHTNGDATAADNVFSFLAPVTTSNYTTLTLPVTITDAQGHNATASISLTVQPPAIGPLAIHTIQGPRPANANGPSVSPYVGQRVQTSGIVTGVGSVGLFIQAKDADADADATTPEGIYVYAGTGNVPSFAVIGNEVQVSGTVATYPLAKNSRTPATELTSSPTITLLTEGNALPTPVTLTTSMLAPNGGLYQLTAYEGMRVSIPSMTAISGTDGSLSSEVNESTTSNGQFFAVITGTPRPMREPGVDIRDSATGLPINVARFDDNPERILVDSKFFGGTGIELFEGSTLTNVTGVLDFTYSNDSYYDPSRLLLDATYSVSNVSVAGVTPVAAPGAKQFTVAAFNVERFFNTSAADNTVWDPVKQATKGSSAVNLTAAAYTRRLAKVSLAIRTILNNPDVVSLEEVENISVVQDIAAQISQDAIAAGQEDPQYVAYGTGTNYAPYTNDIGGISVGFLVKSTRVNTVDVQQYGANSTFIDPRDGTTVQTLNDRPPLVLRAGIKRGDGVADYPVTVISNHLRSLSGVSTDVFARTKKEVQAEYLANLIQQFQSAGEHVVAVGDFNAYEFSDGYNDVLATVTGTGVLPAENVVTPGVGGLVNPPATDLATLLPATERWSYIEYGNAQVLDHIVATADLVSAGATLTFAHLNAGAPMTAYNDANTPARVSDHDVAVGYFAVADPMTSAAVSPDTGTFGSFTVGQSSVGQNFTFTNTGETDLTISGISASSSDYAVSHNCGTTVLHGQGCTINVVFTPSDFGARPGTLTVQTNANQATASLSGTGLPNVMLNVALLHFGNTGVNVTSPAMQVILSNRASRAVTVPLFTNPSADFTVANGNCSQILPSGSNCYFVVSFNPQDSGYKSTTLNLNVSGAALALPLDGTGVNASVTLDQTAMHFGNSGVLVSSNLLTATLVNYTGNPVELTGISAPTADFQVTNNCPATLLAGKACFFRVAFVPQTAGYKSETMTINAGRTQLLLPLDGTGVNASVTMNATAMHFGNSGVLVSSNLLTATLVNYTGNAVTLNGISAPSAEFQVTNNCPATLANGKACNFRVAFVPQSVGYKSATMTITGGGTPLSLPLDGTGVEAKLTLDTTVMHFGHSNVGVSSNLLRAMLVNYTGSAVTLSGIVAPSADFQVTNNCPATLGVGKACFFQVAFVPQSEGYKSATMTIGDVTPVSLPLDGTGVQP